MELRETFQLALYRYARDLAYGDAMVDCGMAAVLAGVPSSAAALLAAASPQEGGELRELFMRTAQDLSIDLPGLDDLCEFRLCIEDRGLPEGIPPRMPDAIVSDNLEVIQRQLENAPASLMTLPLQRYNAHLGWRLMRAYYPGEEALERSNALVDRLNENVAENVFHEKALALERWILSMESRDPDENDVVELGRIRSL